MTNRDEMREAFEKWADGKGYGLRRYQFDENEYANDITQAAWLSRQAAIASMGDVVARSDVAELVGFKAACDERPEDVLSPNLSLLMKIGSIAVHADELLSADGHTFDRTAIESILSQPDVQEWIKEMQKQALLPVTRK